VIHYCKDDDDSHPQRSKHRDVSDSIRKLMAGGFKIYSSWLGEFVVEAQDGVCHWCAGSHELLKLASSR